jgi:hypothetical protein
MDHGSYSSNFIDIGTMTSVFPMADGVSNFAAGGRAHVGCMVFMSMHHGI